MNTCMSILFLLDLDCLYIGMVDSMTVLLAGFVDDILIASANKTVIDKVTNLFHKKFKIKDMGLADEFLNIWITQRPGSIRIDQELIHKLSWLSILLILVHVTMLMCLPCLHIYLAMKCLLIFKQQSYVDAYPYAEIVGSLLYLAVVSRPDIMYAVGVLTRHFKCPTYSSCKAACRVLTYISHHPTPGITYTGCKLDLQVYTDSDWASDKDTRRSTSGFVVLMAGRPVNWLSKLQPIVAVPRWKLSILPVSLLSRTLSGFVSY